MPQNTDEGNPADGHPAEGSQTRRAVVVGGGIAGLISALRLARSGAQTTLIEASGRFGGNVGLYRPFARAGQAEKVSGALAGLRLDVGAESFATKSQAVPQLLGLLGLGDRVCAPNPAGSWIIDAPDVPSAASEPSAPLAVPSPSASLLGIPSGFEAEDIRTYLGPEEADKAAARDREPLGPELREALGASASGDHSLTLGALVAERMGSAVLHRLVAPVVSGVYSVDPEEVELGLIHPRLASAVLEAGSLSGAVARLRADAPAGAAVAGVEGGIGMIAEVLADACREAGADLRASVRVTGLAKSEDGARWQVKAQDSGHSSGFSGEGQEAAELVLDAETVVLAADAAATAALLGLTPQDSPSGVPLRLCTLIFASDSPSARALAQHPRGTGALVTKQARRLLGVQAKALTHASAKWGWVSTGAEGAEVVRLSYNRASEDRLTVSGARIPLGQPRSLSEKAAEVCARDAAAITGTALSLEDVVGTAAVDLENAPASRTEAESGQARERLIRAAAALEKAASEASPASGNAAGRSPSLHLTGAAVAGTGLAAVVQHALTLKLDNGMQDFPGRTVQ